MICIHCVSSNEMSFVHWQALLAEGRFYSDLELTEKEIERMVMEASRAEYLADDSFKQQLGHSSASGAEPSSSAASECCILSQLFYACMLCRGWILRASPFSQF